MNTLINAKQLRASLPDVVDQVRRGARFTVLYRSRPAFQVIPVDAPDQVAWAQLPYEAKGVEGVKDGTPPGFAVMISPRRGLWLQKQLASAGAPLRVKVDVEADYPEKPEQAMVEAWIRGSEIHDQQIVLTAHIQEEMTSANDDGSGCANLVEIGRALARLVKDGTLPRPRRDIRFWWVNELSSQPRYFRDHPDEPAYFVLDRHAEAETPPVRRAA